LKNILIERLKMVDLFSDELKRRAIESSLFLSSYELLKTAIFQLPKTFFGISENDRSAMTDEMWLSINEEFFNSLKKYENEKNSKLHASLRWLQDNDVTKSIFQDEDFLILKKLKDLRDNIAHQNFEYILAGNFKDQSNFDIFQSMLDMKKIHDKLSYWELKNIEQEQNSRFLNEDRLTFKTSYLVLIELFVSIVSDSKLPSHQYLN